MRDQQTDAVYQLLGQTSDLLVRRTAAERSKAITLMHDIAALLTDAAQNDRSMREVGLARQALMRAQACHGAGRSSWTVDDELLLAMQYLHSSYEHQAQTQEWPLRIELAGTDNHPRKETIDAGGTADHETDAG